MTNKPLVSLLMTTYNREKYLAEAIDSVLESTYENIEFIIVDDNSKDNTISIAQSYQEKDSRIKLFKNKINLGDYPNRNKAAEYANGEYLMYVDSDDKLLRDTVEKCMKLILEYPHVGFGIYFPEKDVKEAYVIQSKAAIRRQYFKAAFLQVGPGGVFLRRSFFEEIGKFPVKYGPASDMYFNVKAASKTNILIFPFPLVFYRRHENQELHNQYSYIYNNYRYNRDLISDLELPFTTMEKQIILKKNKRRFVVNVFKFFAKTKDLKRTIGLWKSAEFSIKDFFEGIFH